MFPRVAWLALALGGCGLSLVGTAPEEAGPPSGDGVDASPAEAGEDTALPPGDVANELADPPDAADASFRPDAPSDVAPPPPDPTKVTLSFSAGKDAKVYRFDILDNTFSVFAANGCPIAEETAVLTDGSVFVTSSDNRDFYRVTSAGCTAIKIAGAFPIALGTAPAGTLSPTQEILVGYSGADYVRVDPTNGNVTMIAAGALGALRPSGDVTAIGARGYLAAATGTGSGAFACPAGGDCIVEVSLVTGAPIKLLGQFVGLGIYGLAHSHGYLLFYANGQVFPYDPSTQILGAAIAAAPAGANFSGAGAAPYPPP